MTSGRIFFVLTLNRASALKVSDNEIHLLFASNYSCSRRIGLESKLPPCLFELTILPLSSLKPQPSLSKHLQPSYNLVSKPQNCELKQEPRTLATELHPPLKFHNRERKYFHICKTGWDCSEIVTSGRIFCLINNRFDS